MSKEKTVLKDVSQEQTGTPQTVRDGLAAIAYDVSSIIARIGLLSEIVEDSDLDELPSLGAVSQCSPDISVDHLFSHSRANALAYFLGDIRMRLAIIADFADKIWRETKAHE